MFFKHFGEEFMVYWIDCWWIKHQKNVNSSSYLQSSLIFDGWIFFNEITGNDLNIRGFEND